MNDIELINRAKQGDCVAFQELVKMYQNKIFNFAYSLSGNYTDADDISQEVFVKIHNALPRFREESKFSTWAYSITVNTFYNFYRKKRKYVPLDDTVQIPVFSSLDKPGEGRLKEVMQKALSRLSIKLRSVIIMREYEGLSYAQIAGILKCSIGTVESRLFRARQRLREILQPVFKSLKEGL